MLAETETRPFDTTAAVHDAVRAVAAAEARPSPAAVKAIAAAHAALDEARLRVHDAKPGRLWETSLESRNALVDFINEQVSVSPDEVEAGLMKPVEEIISELEHAIRATTDPDATVTKARLVLRLDEEGFDLSKEWREHLVALSAFKPEPSWEEVAARFRAASVACDAAADLEFEGDSPELRRLHTPIYTEFRQAREQLMATPAPHWAALAVKTKAFLEQYGEEGSDRWQAAAGDLMRTAEAIGDGPPAEADLIQVMHARGYAERVPYFLATSLDGYANWAACIGAVAELASFAEAITLESRTLAEANPTHRMMSGQIISAVWFGKTDLDGLMAMAERP